MYIAHLAFEDWLRAVETEPLDRICIQQNAVTGSIAGAVQTMTTAIIATAAKSVEGPIFAARMRIERVELWSDIEAMRNVVHERAEQALGLVYDATHERVPWATIRRGILLQPGMLEDLHKITTDHALWRWENPDTKDHTERVLGRRLVRSE